MKACAVLALLVAMTTAAPAFVYRIAWDYDGPATFRVYRDGQLVGVSESIRQYIDYSIDENALYVYTVTAVVGGVESDPSDPLTVCTGIRGDVDLDGDLDTADVTTLAMYLCQFGFDVDRHADMDDDLDVDAVDLAALVRCLLPTN